MKTETFGEPVYSWELPFECEIHFNAPRAIPNKKRFSVLNLAGEPPAFMINENEVMQIAPLFDLILTYNENLLKLRNAKKFNYGDQWVTKNPSKKCFSVSFLYSRGVGGELDGYQLRGPVWENRRKITIPQKFWTSTGGIRIPHVEDLEPYPYEKKDELFESMFSIVIENSRIKNYFTEKLIDALRTYTIPIYYGCPNISEYFDSKGIININNCQEMLSCVNRLTPDDYWELMGSMSANYKTAEKYINYAGRLKEVIVNSYNEQISK